MKMMSSKHEINSEEKNTQWHIILLTRASDVRISLWILLLHNSRFSTCYYEKSKCLLVTSYAKLEAQT